MSYSAKKATRLVSELRLFSYADCHCLSMCHIESDTMDGHWRVGSKHHLFRSSNCKLVTVCFLVCVWVGGSGRCGQPIHREAYTFKCFLAVVMDSKNCPLGTDDQWQVQDNWPESAMQSNQRTKQSSCSLWKETCTLGLINPVVYLFKQAKEDTKPTQECRGQFCCLLNTNFPIDQHLQQTHCKPIKIIQQ